MTPNFKNRTLFHGDNLPVLRGIDSNCIDLIATDPPFKKGRDFHATPDSLARGAKFQDRWTWERDVHQDWVDQLMDDYPTLMEAIESAMHAHSKGMGAYICFMAVRLLEMHRILKDSGSIYLHCDPTASHYLKAVMDAIFGQKNFRNEIIWRRTGAHNMADKFGPVHDVLLFYSKSSEYKHKTLFTPYLKGHVDSFFNKEDSRGRYWTNSIHGDGIRNGESGKPWKGFNPTDYGRHWAVPKELVLAFGIDPEIKQHEKLDALYELGLIDLPSEQSKGLPTYRQYLADSKGFLVQDVWAYQPHTKGCLHETDSEIDSDVRWIPPRDKKERTGFPTQKPIALYGRIIRASSNEGDMVLDPFAGCATTCVAAEKLNRQWAGIDIWEKAPEVIIERLNKEGLFAPKRTRRTKENLQTFLFAEDFQFTTAIPKRTDDGQPASPFLRVREVIDEPPNPYKSREAMYDFLLEQHGPKCQGCDRTFDDPRYLELDHNTPRKDGGWNHIKNRILLCGPCNRLKAHRLTLSGLREENKKRGYMRNQP